MEASEPDRSAPTSQAEGSGEAVRETEPEPASTTPATEPAPSGNTFTTASGEVLTYSQKLSVEATAYSCEGYAGTTATGTTARYGAIAVDPSVIPYGTRMYIVSDDGSYIYGYATAEDCGRAIQGYMIDLYFDTLAECYAFAAGPAPCIFWTDFPARLVHELKTGNILDLPPAGERPAFPPGGSQRRFRASAEAVPAAVLLLVQVLIANPPILW